MVTISDLLSNRFQHRNLPTQAYGLDGGPGTRAEADG